MVGNFRPQSAVGATVQRLPMPHGTGSVASAARLLGVGRTFEAGMPGCSARIRVLRGINLNVFPGDMLAITGPPGSGKSTLLLTLAGIVEPDAGSIDWLSAHGRKMRLPDGIEYIPPLSARETIKWMEQALSQSVGMILLDNGLAAFGADGKSGARELLLALRRAQKTVVISGREGGMLRPYCSRMVRLHEGRIC